MGNNHSKHEAFENTGLLPETQENDERDIPPKRVEIQPQHNLNHYKLNPNEAVGASKLFLWFFLIVLIFSLYLLYQVIRPFLHSIILACTFSSLCYPIYRHLVNKCNQRKALASALLILAIAFVIAIPVTLFIVGLIPQAASSISAVNHWLAGNHLGELIANHLDPFISSLDNHFPELELGTVDIRGNLLSFSRSTGQLLLGASTYIVGNTLLIVMHFLLILLLMFYFFINGEALVSRIKYMCPLKPQQTERIIEGLRKMARSVFAGGFLIAILQGLVGGIGLAIVGIPALFWGTLMAFASLVPVVGTGLIWVPAAAFLFLSDEKGYALFLALWCGILVSSIDSLLRPFLMKGGGKVPVLFLFLSILGGIQAFGMLGLLYGPMILGLVAVMLSIYNEEYDDILSQRG